jgi:hypothetical protein
MLRITIAAVLFLLASSPAFASCDRYKYGSHEWWACVPPPPVNASKFFPSVGMWSGADVCPASMCGFSRAAGLYGDARIGSNTLTPCIKIIAMSNLDHRDTGSARFGDNAFLEGIAPATA